MSNRVATTIVLVEDDVQKTLAYRFLKVLRGSDFNHHKVRQVTVPQGKGSGEAHVRRSYPEEVRSIRSALGNRASAFLIVMVDADTDTVANRERQLAEELSKRGADSVRGDEPIVCLIPKRNVETWLRELSGETCDESTDYKKKSEGLDRDAIKEAASTLFEWTRPNATPPGAITDSLRAALPRWGKIPR